MKKYLIKECSDCKGILRIITEDDKIIHMEGCRQYNKISYRRNGRMHVEKSNKLVVCLHEVTAHGNIYAYQTTCGRYSIVKSFKEITL